MSQLPKDGCNSSARSLDGKDEKDEKAVDDTTLSAPQISFRCVACMCNHYVPGTDATNNESTRPQYELGTQ